MQTQKNQKNHKSFYIEEYLNENGFANIELSYEISWKSVVTKTYEKVQNCKFRHHKKEKKENLKFL